MFYYQQRGLQNSHFEKNNKENKSMSQEIYDFFVVIMRCFWIKELYYYLIYKYSTLNIFKYFKIFSIMSKLLYTQQNTPTLYAHNVYTKFITSKRRRRKSVKETLCA